MRYLPFTLIFAVLPGACATGHGAMSPSMSGSAILERHVAQSGGEDALSKIDNMRVKARVFEPGYDLLIDYRAARSGLMRVDVFSGDERVFSEGIDAEGGWQQGGRGADITGMTQEAEARLRRGVTDRFTSLAEQAKIVGGATLIGEETIDAALYDVVELRGSDGHVRQYLANRKTGRIERMRETEALHPDIDATEEPEEEIWTDFAEYCGMIIHRKDRTINRRTGEEIQRSEVLSKSCNLPGEDLDLGRPSD